MRTPTIVINLSALLVVLCLTISAGYAGEADPAKEILALTGGVRAKFVWINRAEPGADEKFSATSAKAQLMFLDTDAGKARVLQPAGNGYCDPTITRDGERVIWSERGAKTSFILDLASGTKSVLSKDPECWYVLCTRYDEPSKTDVIYAYNGAYGEHEINVADDAKPHPVYCFPLDKGPSAKQIVWNKTPIDARAFTVSADGTMAAACFPWPKAGIAKLPNGGYDVFNGDPLGCNPCMAPDSSHRFFFMEGDHISIYLWDDPQSDTKKTMRVTGMPGNNDKDTAWRPRWTNHIRYLAISSPLGDEQDWLHLDEVYVGRFDEKFTKIESWVQITQNKSRDIDLCGWFANGVAPAGTSKPKPPMK